MLSTLLKNPNKPGVNLLKPSNPSKALPTYTANQLAVKNNESVWPKLRKLLITDADLADFNDDLCAALMDEESCKVLIEDGVYDIRDLKSLTTSQLKLLKQPDFNQVLMSTFLPLLTSFTDHKCSYLAKPAVLELVKSGEISLQIIAEAADDVNELNLNQGHFEEILQSIAKKSLKQTL